MIYMDYNASSPLKKHVFAAMHELGTLPLNASSIHNCGRRARGVVEGARQNLARLVNAGGRRVIFTASGTESNNMVLLGLEKYKILVSSIEHASILKIGVHAHEIPVNSSGIVDVAGIERLMRQYAGKKMLVSVMLANNETGVVQPIKEIAQIVHKHGGLMHSDASQAIGRITVDMDDLGVDMLTISAHKFGGPQGAAALIIGKNVPLKSLILGGAQEQGYRAGTENVAAIHGFGVAAADATHNCTEIETVSNLRNKIETDIKNFAPDAVIFGQNVPRLPNTTMVAMPYVAAHTQIMHFDMAGIMVSSGAACSSGKVETSHVLLAMGVAPQLAGCAIRVSLGYENTYQQAEQFVAAWRELYERTRLKDCA